MILIIVVILAVHLGRYQAMHTELKAPCVDGLQLGMDARDVQHLAGPPEYTYGDTWYYNIAQKENLPSRMITFDDGKVCEVFGKSLSDMGHHFSQQGDPISHFQKEFGSYQLHSIAEKIVIVCSGSRVEVTTAQGLIVSFKLISE